MEERRNLRIHILIVKSFLSWEFNLFFDLLIILGRSSPLIATTINMRRIASSPPKFISLCNGFNARQFLLGNLIRLIQSKRYPLSLNSKLDADDRCSNERLSSLSALKQMHPPGRINFWLAIFHISSFESTPLFAIFSHYETTCMHHLRS